MSQHWLQPDAVRRLDDPTINDEPVQEQVFTVVFAREDMFPATTAQDRDLPTRRIHDRSADRFRVVVDAFPATVDEVSVAVASRRIRVRIECPTDDGLTTFERSFAPPSVGLEFDGERRAWYKNGVLTVAVETTPKR